LNYGGRVLCKYARRRRQMQKAGAVPVFAG